MEELRLTTKPLVKISGVPVEMQNESTRKQICSLLLDQPVRCMYVCIIKYPRGRGCVINKTDFGSCDRIYWTFIQLVTTVHKWLSNALSSSDYTLHWKSSGFQMNCRLLLTSRYIASSRTTAHKIHPLSTKGCSSLVERVTSGMCLRSRCLVMVICVTHIYIGVCGLVDAISRYFAGGTEDNHEKRQPKRLLYRSRIEASTSRIPVQDVTARKACRVAPALYNGNLSTCALKSESAFQ
jgi:hypothetical protein